ncbi:hypothetical protein [Methylocystis echinoides]|jgi:hypothetical protein|uniref:hypothetical protein n=1 Tax=Methylocystis echinoides TaxID=29468 RepID=UPI0034167B25
MSLAAPLAVGIAVAAICGLGGCVVAHRLLPRFSGSKAHCATPAEDAKGLRRIAPLLFSALACGAVMAAALYLLPSP